MTTLTMRVVRGDFIVTGPDIEPMKFKSRREAKDRCESRYPGSPITETQTCSLQTARATERVR